MLGDYLGNGRIAELNDNFNPAQPTSGSNPYSINHDDYALTVTREARAGDANLNGQVNFDDYQDLFGNYNGTGKRWYEGDFNGDGNVTFDDYQDLFGNYNAAYTVGAGGSIGGGPGVPGAGGGGGSPVPEPTAAVLALIASGLFLARRTR
jgi:hypothetical protein